MPSTDRERIFERQSYADRVELPAFREARPMARGRDPIAIARLISQLPVFSRPAMHTRED